MVSAGAVKIEIRKEIFLAAHDLLDTLGDRVETRVAVSSGEFLRPGLDDIGARIGDFIDAVAKTHNELLRRDHFQHASFRGVRRREFLDQRHCRFVGAAVQRPAQRADGARHRRIEIGQRRYDRARSEGRGVEFMLGVENERHVDGAADKLVGLLAVEQMEKVAGGGLVVGFGVDVLTARVEMVPIKQHRAKTGRQPVCDGELIVTEPFGLECAEHRAAGAHNVHRMRVARDLFEHPFQGSRQPAQAAQFGPVFEQVALLGEPPIDQKIGDLFEARMLGEIVDGIAPVGEPFALFADGRDRRLSGDDSREAGRVVRCH